MARRLATRADGTLTLASGPVHWEGLDFEFTAPLKDHLSARSRGIENIICRLLRTGVGPGATVLDVGASYGFVTLVGAITVGPTGRVISAECDPGVVTTLRATIAANGVADRVRVVEATVGPPGGGLTVDELVASTGRGVDFLKIDTDGDDLGVLQGAETAVTTHHPLLVVELAADQEAIVSWLRERYRYVVDQFGADIAAAPWPANAIAMADRPAWLDGCWTPPPPQGSAREDPHGRG